MIRTGSCSISVSFASFRSFTVFSVLTERSSFKVFFERESVPESSTISLSSSISKRSGVFSSLSARQRIMFRITSRADISPFSSAMLFRSISREAVYSVSLSITEISFRERRSLRSMTICCRRLTAFSS